MGYLSQSYRITGVVPLIMHNGQTRDPLNEWSKRLKKVTGKRNKTDADHEQMAKIEWYASLYTMNGLPCLPGECWEGHLLEAGKKIKMGKQVQAGVLVPGACLVEYDGPKSIDELWEDITFRFTRAVKVQRAAVMRTRAIFAPWACTVEVKYDPLALDLAQLTQIITIGGETVGIGDWRPKYGRYEVEVL